MQFEHTENKVVKGSNADVCLIFVIYRLPNSSLSEFIDEFTMYIDFINQCSNNGKITTVLIF